MALTHNDIAIGNTVKFANGDRLTVTDVLDGHRGIGVTRTGDIHSRDRWFVDVAEIREVAR